MGGTVIGALSGILILSIIPSMLLFPLAIFFARDEKHFVNLKAVLWIMALFWALTMLAVILAIVDFHGG